MSEVAETKSKVLEQDRGEKSFEVASSEPRWTIDEEKAVLRKLDFFLMPMLIAGFFVLQLDRSNIGNALTDTITKDLKMTTDDVNLGSQLMSIGIVVAEIPSNLILQRLGAPIWLTFQMFVWGTIALTQAWCTNIHSFYATRFLLGFWEGGYIPGAQYMLALFYTRKELARRTAIFYFGNYSAAATGSLIAAGVLQMAGISGLSGWQWLFILQRIHGRWDYFSERERTIMRSRVVDEDETKGEDKASITLNGFTAAVVDYRLWLHMILNVVSLAPKGGLQLYGPTVIKSLGFSKINANLLNAVSSVLVIILSYLISVGSDKTGLRGPWCIVAFIWSIVFAGALFGLPIGSNKWTRYAIFTLLSGGNALSQGLNDAWLSINAMQASNRSLGLAMVVMGSNLGAIAGQQLFRKSDSPRYNRAFLSILLLYAAAIPITLIMMWVYWRDNKKNKRKP